VAVEDAVVFGVPVYAGRVPNVLLKYLDKVQGNGALAVPIVLFGNRNYDDALIELRNILEKNGFAINNVSLGVGSFSMQCLETMDGNTKQYSPYTRDVFGIAVKATYAEDAASNPIMIFKNPKTDSGHFKKSQRGCCRVMKKNGEYSYEDGLTWAEVQEDNELQTVFKDGQLVREYTLNEVRQNLHQGKF